MIRFRTLGSLDLRTAGDVPLQSILAQPRRTAILAYLALGLPGFRRKDAIYALFWRDSDADSARHALRQTVYYLRRALGDDVVVTRGSLELGLSPDRFCCDAAAFQAAADAGRPEDALDLYRGDLLEGFFATGAPDFERWVEAERARLRELAADVAWRLADGREAGGDLAGAVHAGRRALGLAPADEVALRRLLGLLDRVGDRAGAVRSYEEFAARLRGEYELEPSADTVALLEAIRAEPARIGQPVGGGGAAAGSAVGDARPAPAAGASGSGPSEGPGQAVAVFPFADPDGAGPGSLGETVAELLSADLRGTRLQPIEPRRARDAARGDGTLANLDVARDLAARLGAGVFVLGSIIRGGDRIRAVATLFEAGGRELVSADSVIEGEDQLFELSAGLGRQLLAGYSERCHDALRGAHRETTSLTALHHFYDGELQLAAARMGRAIDAYQRAVAADPAFVSAWMRMAFAAALGFRVDISEHAGARATALAGRLDPPDASQLRALLFLLDGEGARAGHCFRALLDVYPERADGWVGLGLTRLVTNPLRGRPIAEARPAFERAVELAPHVLHPLIPLAYLAAVEHRYDDFAILADRLGPDHDFAPLMRLTAVFAYGDDDARDAAIGWVRTLPDLVIHEAARYVAHLTSDLDGAIRIARIVTDPGRIPEVRATGHVIVANLELARERTDAALAELDAVHAIDPDLALEQRALLAALPWLPATTEELVRLRAQVARRIPTGSPTTPRPRGPFTLHDGIRGDLWIYLHGVLSARLGDADAALDAARRLERDSRVGPPGPVLRDLGRGVRSYLAEQQGDPAGALDILAGAEPGRPLRDLMFHSPFYSGVLERFRRGRLLLALGRGEEARPWLETISESSVYGLAYAPEVRRLLDGLPAA